MREMGLQGVVRGRPFKTTVTDHAAFRPPDLVQRDMTIWGLRRDGKLPKPKKLGNRNVTLER